MTTTTEQRIDTLVAQTRELRGELLVDLDALDARRKVVSDQLRGLDSWLGRFDPQANGHKRKRRSSSSTPVARGSVKLMRRVLEVLLADEAGQTRADIQRLTGFGQSSVEKALIGLRHPPYELIYRAGHAEQRGKPVIYKAMKGASLAKLDADN